MSNNKQDLIIDNPTLESMSEFFKVMGDSTRLSILYALLDNEYCVTDLCNVLQMNQSAISHQLKILKASKLVKSRRDGRSIFYSLDDQHIHEILALTLTHINEK